MAKHKHVPTPAPSASGDGVSINLISRRTMSRMSVTEKIRFILDEVKQSKILVLEAGLDPVEETRLIETTMAEIDPDTFIGIELSSQRLPNEKLGIGERILRRTGIAAKSMTVVGPADMLQTVHKDGNTVQAMILTGKKVGA